PASGRPSGWPGTSPPSEHRPSRLDAPTWCESGVSELACHGPISHHWHMISQANGSLRAEELASALSGWSDSAHGPLARRLANAIRGAVASGLIGDQMRIPPERTVARSLGVSRSTITAALDELR